MHALRLLGCPGRDDVGARGRRDEPEVLRGQPVAREVVDHPSPLVADGGVQDLAVLQPALHIADEQTLEQRLRVRPFDVDRSLVVDVVHAGALARREVLLPDGGEPHGRVEADAVAELGAELHEAVVVRRVPSSHHPLPRAVGIRPISV